MIELLPPPAGSNFTQEQWNAIPGELRSEISRIFRELAQGIAIQKDRRAGRVKRASGGWYELHQLETGHAGPAKLARIAELRDSLAAEEARFAKDDDLAEFHEMAEVGGMTLADALRKYIATENMLRTDFDKGLRILARKVGIDLTAWAQRVFATDEVA